MFKPGLYSMRMYARVCAPICAHTPTVCAAVYTPVASCAQRIRQLSPSKFKHVELSRPVQARAGISANQGSAEVTEGRHIVLHRDICGRIPMHTLVCLYSHPRCNLRYAVAMHRQTQVWTFPPAASAYAHMEYKPGFTHLVSQNVVIISLGDSLSITGHRPFLNSLGLGKCGSNFKSTK